MINVNKIYKNILGVEWAVPAWMYRSMYDKEDKLQILFFFSPPQNLTQIYGEHNSWAPSLEN